MEMPPQAPVMILQNATLFPQALMPLYIFEPRYRRLLMDVLRGDRMFALACRRRYSSQERAERVAGLGLVRACVRHADGAAHLVLQGLGRIELKRTVRYKPYRVCEIEPMESQTGPEEVVASLAGELLRVVGDKLKDLGEGSIAAITLPAGVGHVSQKTAVEVFRNLLEHLNSIKDPEQVVDLVSAALLSDPAQRQTILETRPLEVRMLHLLSFLEPFRTTDEFDVPF